MLRDARDAHRDPNIIHFYAQGSQHNTYCAHAHYHRKPIKKDANIILFHYLVASKGMVGLPVEFYELFPHGLHALVNFPLASSVRARCSK